MEKEHSGEKRLKLFVKVKITDKKAKRNALLMDAVLLLGAIIIWAVVIFWKDESTHAIGAAASITTIFILFAIGNHVMAKYGK